MNTIENSFFTVFRDNELSPFFQKVLTHLYMPLVGSESVNLYQTFSTFIMQGENESIRVSHLKLLHLLNMSADVFLKERKKLEAVGLIEAYYNKNDYIYKLNSPLGPNEFFKNEILSSFLCQTLGKEEYNNKMCEFLLHRFDLSLYENITSSFDDIYTTTTTKNQDFITLLTQGGEIRIVNSHFDFKFLMVILEPLNLLNKEILNSRKFYDLVNRYSFLYQLKTEEIKDAIIASLVLIDEKYEIDTEKFIKECKRLYDGHTVKPQIAPINQAPNNKLISFLDSASPLDVVKNTFGFGLASSDINLFDTLLKNTGVSLGILNVLIIYVLKEKNGEIPSYAYFDKVIKTWQRKGIKTTQEAIDTINGRVPNMPHAKSKKKLPNWYDDYLKEFNKQNEKNSDDVDMDAVNALFKFGGK